MTAPHAFFSKCPTARQRFVQEWVGWHQANHPGATVLHLHPKNVARAPYAPGVVCAAYEDVTKRDVWLRINNLIADSTMLVLENPSRYPKITSEKVRFLRRLSMRLKGARILTDLTPFTLSVEYLYTPYSYLGRDILGYPHWYAFRENYQELTPAGEVVNALDFPVLARKAAPVSAIDYCGFLPADRETLRLQETDAEHARYQERREQLFARYEEEGASGTGPPQKIITRLADTTHAFETRRAAAVETVADLAARTDGRIVAVVNLLSYAQELGRRFRSVGLPERCTAISYQVGASGQAPTWSDVGAVLWVESPIVNSHWRLDIEAVLPTGCISRSLLGSTKVDAYLYDLIHDETEQIDGFTRALWLACQARLKTEVYDATL